MRLLGKKKNTPNLILKRHLLAIATQLARMTSARWDYASVSFVLYGLQSVREGDAGLKLYVTTMTSIIEGLREKGKIPPCKLVSVALLGLQNKACIDEELKDLIRLPFCIEYATRRT